MGTAKKVKRLRVQANYTPLTRMGPFQPDLDFRVQRYNADLSEFIAGEGGQALPPLSFGAMTEVEPPDDDDAGGVPPPSSLCLPATPSSSEDLQNGTYKPIEPRLDFVISEAEGIAYLETTGSSNGASPFGLVNREILENEKEYVSGFGGTSSYGDLFATFKKRNYTFFTSQNYPIRFYNIQKPLYSFTQGLSEGQSETVSFVFPYTSHFVTKDGNSYYYGEFEIAVKEDFGSMSYEFLHTPSVGSAVGATVQSYGGTDNIIFDSGCMPTAIDADATTTRPPPTLPPGVTTTTPYPSTTTTAEPTTTTPSPADFVFLDPTHPYKTLPVTDVTHPDFGSYKELMPYGMYQQSAFNGNRYFKSVARIHDRNDVLSYFEPGIPPIIEHLYFGSQAGSVYFTPTHPATLDINGNRLLFALWNYDFLWSQLDPYGGIPAALPSCEIAFFNNADHWTDSPELYTKRTPVGIGGGTVVVLVPQIVLDRIQDRITILAQKGLDITDVSYAQIYASMFRDAGNTIRNTLDLYPNQANDRGEVITADYYATSDIYWIKQFLGFDSLFVDNSVSFDCTRSFQSPEINANVSNYKFFTNLIGKDVYKMLKATNSSADENLFVWLEENVDLPNVDDYLTRVSSIGQPYTFNMTNWVPEFSSDDINSYMRTDLWSVYLDNLPWDWYDSSRTVNELIANGFPVGVDASGDLGLHPDLVSAINSQHGLQESPVFAYSDVTHSASPDYYSSPSLVLRTPSSVSNFTFESEQGRVDLNLIPGRPSYERTALGDYIENYGSFVRPAFTPSFSSTFDVSGNTEVVNNFYPIFFTESDGFFYLTQTYSGSQNFYDLSPSYEKSLSGKRPFLIEETGIYIFHTDADHPITFHNHGKEADFFYTGDNLYGSKVGLDGNTYNFYTGFSSGTVYNLSYGDIFSYECYNDGYMGGFNNLVFGSSNVSTTNGGYDTIKREVFGYRCFIATGDNPNLFDLSGNWLDDSTPQSGDNPWVEIPPIFKLDKLRCNESGTSAVISHADIYTGDIGFDYPLDHNLSFRPPQYGTEDTPLSLGFYGLLSMYRNYYREITWPLVNPQHSKYFSVAHTNSDDIKHFDNTHIYVEPSDANSINPIVFSARDKFLVQEDNITGVTGIIDITISNDTYYFNGLESTNGENPFIMGAGNTYIFDLANLSEDNAIAFSVDVSGSISGSVSTKSITGPNGLLATAYYARNPGLAEAYVSFTDFNLKSAEISYFSESGYMGGSGNIETYDLVNNLKDNLQIISDYNLNPQDYLFLSQTSDDLSELMKHSYDDEATESFYGKYQLHAAYTGQHYSKIAVANGYPYQNFSGIRLRTSRQNRFSPQTYVFYTDAQNPIAFHNHGQTGSFFYTGNNLYGSKVGLDGNTYNFYTGFFSGTVYDFFDPISFESYHSGYMNGQNVIHHDSLSGFYDENNNEVFRGKYIAPLPKYSGFIDRFSGVFDYWLREFYDHNLASYSGINPDRSHSSYINNLEKYASSNFHLPPICINPSDRNTTITYDFDELMYQITSFINYSGQRVSFYPNVSEISKLQNPDVSASVKNSLLDDSYASAFLNMLKIGLPGMRFYNEHIDLGKVFVNDFADTLTRNDTVEGWDAWDRFMENDSHPFDDPALIDQRTQGLSQLAKEELLSNYHTSAFTTRSNFSITHDIKLRYIERFLDYLRNNPYFTGLTREDLFPTMNLNRYLYNDWKSNPNETDGIEVLSGFGLDRSVQGMSVYASNESDYAGYYKAYVSRATQAITMPTYTMEDYLNGQYQIPQAACESLQSVNFCLSVDRRDDSDLIPQSPEIKNINFTWTTGFSNHEKAYFIGDPESKDFSGDTNYIFKLSYDYLGTNDAPARWALSGANGYLYYAEYTYSDCPLTLDNPYPLWKSKFNRISDGKQVYLDINAQHCIQDYYLSSGIPLDVSISYDRKYYFGDTSGYDALVSNNRCRFSYFMDSGVYIFSGVPTGHPIAFHNYGKEDRFSYTGDGYVASKTGLDGNEYRFYTGIVTGEALQDFGSISYECFYHGYMGGFLNLHSIMPPPPPTTQPPTTQPPPTTTAVPTTTAEPVTTTAELVTTTAEPVTTTEDPQGTTTQGPEGTTQGPEGTTQGPEGTTQGPEGTTQGPEGTTQGPEGTQSPTPGATTEEPFTTEPPF